jgi:hypothetical protein
VSDSVEDTIVDLLRQALRLAESREAHVPHGEALEREARRTWQQRALECERTRMPCLAAEAGEMVPTMEQMIGFARRGADDAWLNANTHTAEMFAAIAVVLSRVHEGGK